MADRRDQDERLAARLGRRRPKPAREFALELSDRLADLEAARRRPAHLWALVAMYLGCGLLLLAVAVAGAAGAGLLG